MAEKVMSNLQEELLKEKAQARRPWWWMAGIFGVLFLILGVLVFKDIPPPDDAWMLPEFTAGGGPRNDLVVFIENVTKLPSFDVKLPDQEVLNVDLDRMEEARQFLAENASHFALYDELMKTQTSGWRWPENQELLVSTKYAYLKTCSRTSELAAMRVKLLAREGKSEEACEEAVKVMHFAYALSKAEGVLIHWLVAMYNQRIAMDALGWIVSWCEMDESHLKRIQNSLAPLSLGREEYLFTLKAEYHFSKGRIENLNSFGDEARVAVGLEMPWWMTTFYQPNRSLEMMLQLNKPVVQALSHDWSEAFIAMREADYITSQKAKKSWQYLISPNAGGNALMTMLLRFEECGGRTIQHVALFRQTLIIIAMRRFELANGKLPGRLEDLAPQYLAEVPLDPFDNKPMRWNVQTNVVYSVGKDLKDASGKVRRPWKTSDDDVGLHYFWKPEKVEKK